MEPPAGPAEAVDRPSATSRLRLLGYAAVLTALPFSQATGRIVPDTKIDLVLAPWRFLAQAARMWDPVEAFGQIQNQADGYLWPMGPFFAVGRSLALPAWVIQRLWWAVLLNLAFFGILALCRELRVGRPWTQVAAAAAYVLAPRATTIIGVSSVELWPTALAPWVLLAIVRGSRRGSVVRAGAAAGLLVGCCGGVNATAVAAVLPPGVIWLLTRPRGPRRWRLLGWWALFTGLSCLWWLVPLALQGRYSSPFLDYIETASVTGSVTDLGRSLLGVSNWVAYASPGQYPAGATLVTTAFLVLDAAAVSALGLIGLASRRHPQQRFAVLTLLVGLALVGLGYAGQLHGWDAAGREHLLDGVLSALRNTHKFDLMVRLALSLGVAHALTIVLDHGRDVHADLRRVANRVLIAATAVALVGLSFPWLDNEVAAPGGFDAVPAYWNRVASYLEANAHGGIALEVPAAPFGDYTWGDTQDDVLEPLARSPWAVRNVVPLAEPGNVDLLDEITASIESGEPPADLADVLAVAGVSELVVRNDLDRYVTGAPDPAYLHAALDAVPGLTRIAGFGPWVGSAQVTTDRQGVRTVADNSLSGRYRSVEVYRVGPAAPGDALIESASESIAGTPGNAAPLTLAGDLPAGTKTDLTLTDGLRRQDEAFQAVRQSRSATLPAGSAPQRPGPEQFHRIFPDQRRWQTVETWRGIAGVSASSSQGYASADPPILPATGPASALDGDPATGWHTDSAQSPSGQWIRIAFDAPTSVPSVTVSVPEGAVPVATMTIAAGGVTRVVRAPAPGGTRTYRVDATAARSVRVTSGPSGDTGWWGIAELSVPGVHPQRVLALPKPPAGATVSAIELHRDGGSTACPTVGGVTTCNPAWGTAGDDGETIARSFVLPAAGSYQLRGEASLSTDPDVSAKLAARAGVGLTVTGDGAIATADAPVAMIDGSLGTSWDASPGSTPTIHLTLPAVEHLTSLTLAVGRADPVAAPDLVRVTVDGHSVTGHLDADGTIALPGWRARRVRIAILSAHKAYSTVFGVQVPLGPGVSQLEVDGRVPGTETVTGVCGDGPSVDVDGRVVRTEAGGRLTDLLRGRETTVSPCSGTVPALPKGASTVVASPGGLFVPDDVDLLDLDLASDQSFTAVPVGRDDDGTPVSARMPAEPHAVVLSLPQNFDAGWKATLDGRTLTPRRVDGWQQGWVVPAHLTGTVRFSFPPQRWWSLGLWAGLGGALVTLLAFLFVRRPRLPENDGAAAPPGVLDLAVVVVVLGLVAGWIGLGIGLVLGVVSVRVRPALGAIAATATLLAAMPLMFLSLGSGGAVSDWRQCWAVVACAAVAAGALAGMRGTKGPRFLSRSTGRSRKR